MEKAYTPKERIIDKGNLRELAPAYLTGGRYDPRKSDMRAEAYKQQRQQAEQRRKELRELNSLFISNVSEGLRKKLRY